MRLYEGEAGSVYMVEAVVQKKLGEEWTRRLKSLGVVKGTRLLLLTKKKGGTAAVKIRGTRLALGRKLVEAIEILPLEEPAAEWKERRRQTVEESE